MHSQSDVEIIIFSVCSKLVRGESYNLSKFIDEIVNFISYFSIPRDVADHLFQYLTDTHVRQLIIANGRAGGQLFDNMRASKEHFDNIPKCWDCWPKTQVTVYTRGCTPQPRDGPCVGYCRKK